MIRPTADIVKGGQQKSFASVKAQIQSTLLSQQQTAHLQSVVTKLEKQQKKVTQYAAGYAPPKTSTPPTAADGADPDRRLEPMATLIALGPGDPDLIPLASWRALEAAGPGRAPGRRAAAEWLGAHGIALDADAPVAAASGERLRRLLAARAWDETVPAGAALQSLVLADAMVALQRLTERLRRDCPWDREQTVGTIVPHTVEEAYEVAEAAARGHRREAPGRAGRPALPDVLPRPPVRGGRRRRPGRQWPPASRRS